MNTYIIKDIDCFLKSIEYVSPWISNKITNFESIISNIKPRHYSKKSIIFRQDEINNHVYIVESGRVKLFVNEISGTENCTFIAEKGCLFGEISIIDELQNNLNATAIVDSQIYKIPSETFINQILIDPNFAYQIYKNLAVQVRILNSELIYFTKTAAKRVSVSLLSLALQYGIQRDDYICIGIKFTHEEIGNLTGLTRVTVSKVYNFLYEEKIITIRDGRVIILSPYRMMDLIKSRNY